MKQYIFMFITLLFLVACGDGSLNGNDNSSINGDFSGNGTYGAPILNGDIKVNIATGILIKKDNEVYDNASYNIKAGESVLFYTSFAPIATKDVSTFEVMTMQSKFMSLMSSCHTGFPSNNCSATFVYTPQCNGLSQAILKVGADNVPSKAITVIGESSNFPNNCLPNTNKDTKYTVDKNNHQFKNINEIFYFKITGDKPVNNNFKISANGALRGFYYSYACFYNDNNCYGFIQLTGKIGKHECKGGTSFTLKINPDPLLIPDNESIKISVSGFGLGRDEEVYCEKK